MSRGVGGGFPRVRHAQHHGYGTEKYKAAENGATLFQQSVGFDCIRFPTPLFAPLIHERESPSSRLMSGIQ
jgi:hypothetical protein